MNTKFKKNDAVKYGTEEVKVTATRKDFSTKKISYYIAREDGNAFEVQENEIVRISPEKPLTEIEILREKYVKGFGKPCAVSRKNDAAWLIKKIEGEQAEQPKVEDGKRVLMNLSEEGLHKLIEEKGIDIEADDFISKEDLVNEILLKLKK